MRTDTDNVSNIPTWDGAGSILKNPVETDWSAENSSVHRLLLCVLLFMCDSDVTVRTFFSTEFEILKNRCIYNCIIESYYCEHSSVLIRQESMAKETFGTWVAA